MTTLTLHRPGRLRGAISILSVALVATALAVVPLGFTGAASAIGIEAAESELAQSGSNVMLPVLLGLLTVAIGGLMTLVSLVRRRYVSRRV